MKLLKRKLKYTDAIKFYAIADIVLFVIAFLTRNLSFGFSIVAFLFSLTGYMFILEMKFSYPQWYVTVSPGLYFVVLFIVPPLVTDGIAMAVSEENIKYYMVEEVVYLFAKLGLYVRAYILGHKYNLNKYQTEEEVAKDYPTITDRRE